MKIVQRCNSISRVIIFCVASVAVPYLALADLFGSGTNQFSINFVTIGHAGNVADSSGHGSVGYQYRIGRTEVSIDQFFKARAVDSRIGDGGENLWNNGFHTVGANAPVANVQWYDAAKFCNWLTTGDAHDGIYQFNGGGVLIGLDRSYRNENGIAYLLPNEDEWYKAAYFKQDASGYSLYAHGLDTPPLAGTNGWNYLVGFGGEGDPSAWQVGMGAEEQNGTFDMNGNVREWTESAEDGILDALGEDRVSRGGEYLAGEFEMRSTTTFSPPPEMQIGGLGFRVASIPEPSSALLLMVGAGGLLFARRRQRMKWRR